MASYFNQIQFELWLENEVADWLKGLDDVIHQYIPNFIQREIDGRKLLMLTHSDLEKLGVTKLGHQELIMEGVDLLKSLRYMFETENLQHLALQLGCKARSLHNEILARGGENDQNKGNVVQNKQKNHLSNSTLSAVCDIISSLKILTSWLDRAPFESIHDMGLLRNSLVKLGLEMVTVTMKDKDIGVIETENAIIKTCQDITGFCDELVLNMKESLVVQPASLEFATIRKKMDDELGMHIHSSYYGIHVIGCIKDRSPADLCSKIEKGDEVLQVNNQTVHGWQLAKLVAALREKPREVTMLLKKRPRHTNPFGHIQNRRHLGSRHVPSVATLPKPIKKRRSRDGEKPSRPTLQEYVTSSVPTGDIYITKESPEDNNDGNDTDNDVFRSGSESPQFTLPVIVDAKQRRATVSGGSPTFERPSLVVEDFGTVTVRPKSQAINLAEREAAIAALLAADNSLQRKTSLRREGKISSEKNVHLSEGSDKGKDKDSNENSPARDLKAEAGDDVNVDNEKDIKASEEKSVVKDDTENDTKTDITDTEDAEQEELRSKNPDQTRGQDFVVTRPTPVFIDSSLSSKKSWNKQQRIVSTEVAGNSPLGDAPQLMRMRRLDSQPSNELDKTDDDDVFVKPTKKVGFSDSVGSEEKAESFTHIVAGGMIQKIATDKVAVQHKISGVKMRNKTSSRTKLDRRVSCKDLGRGDCEGWLYKRKKKDRALSKHWDKRWCVLQKYNLFYYKHRDELKAEGVIHLPAFQVSPAPNLKTRKFAFKIHNSGASFYFASERQDDMGKWMNKMGLASISYTSSERTESETASKVEKSSISTQNDYSESEDEGDDQTDKSHSGSVMSINSISSFGSTSSPQMSPVVRRHHLKDVKDTVGASNEELRAMYNSIHCQDLTIDGKDKVAQRRSQITATTDLEGEKNSDEIERLRKLNSLQRTLKAKELELQEIDSLISEPVSPSQLGEFAGRHQSLCVTPPQ